MNEGTADHSLVVWLLAALDWAVAHPWPVAVGILLIAGWMKLPKRRRQIGRAHV